MIYIMEKSITNSGTYTVIDTDDLVVEEVSGELCSKFIKAGERLVFPFHQLSRETCKVEVSGDWYVIYAMCHEPRTQGLHIHIGRKGQGKLMHKNFSNIVWNAYPSVEIEVGSEHLLVRIDWTDKHYYHEDSEEEFVQYLGISKDGAVILDTPAYEAQTSPYFRINEKGKVKQVTH